MSNLRDFTGRYEIDADRFAETLKDEPKENIQQFDLKTAFPDELAATRRLPKAADKLWRLVMDETIAELGGAYSAVDNSTFVQVWMENIPASAARAKLPHIAQKIKIMFGRVRDAKDNADAVLKELFPPPKVKEARAAPVVSPELAYLLQHGLPSNPSPGIFDVWVNRTAISILHNPQPTPFDKEVMTLVSRSDVSYMPFWTPANELLVGSVAQVRSTVGVAQYTPAEPLRQELVALFSNCFQMSALATKKIYPLGFVSLRAATLANRPVMELISAFLSRVSSDVRKNLICEVRGIPQDGLSGTVKKSIEMLAPHFKAYILETGAFAKDDYKDQIPKLHACGFDASALQLPEIEILGLTRKYADLYKNRPQKTYIRGVTMPRLIKVAKDVGYMYLNGPAVHPAEKFCTGIRQFPIRL